LKEIYKKKTSREHILERPNMYIGASNVVEVEDYCLVNDKIQRTSVKCVPGLLKIINEIIDNSVDIAIKTNFEGCNSVSVKITDDTVVVEDNGPGIPVSKNPEGEYIPFVCWGYAMSGSNFDNDENRTHLGMNGVGSYCTNVWSTEFTGISDDSKNRYTVKFKNNALDYKETVSDSVSKGVTVKFKPDLKRFGIEKIDQTHKDLVYQRLLNLSISFPLIQFKFNNKAIKTKNFKSYVSSFADEGSFEVFQSDNFSFAVIPSPSDEFQQFSYLNGLNIKDGGTHIDVIANNIVSLLRDSLSKKYKTIKPADIKNKLMVVGVFKNFANPKFNSQTKEKLTNSVSEVNRYFGDIDYQSLSKKILKNSNIISPIIEVFKIKEELKNRQELKTLNKAKKIKDEHYLPALKESKYIMVVEGLCLDENTEVLTSDFRSKQIRDIDIGDTIIDSNFNPVTVLSKSHKLTKTLRVNFRDGYVICGLEHPFFVYNKERKIFEYVKAKDLNSNYSLVRSKIRNDARFSEVLDVEEKRLFLEETYVDFTDDDFFCVIRDGRIQRVKGTEIVKGDCLILQCVS